MTSSRTSWYSSLGRRTTVVSYPQKPNREPSTTMVEYPRGQSTHALLEVAGFAPNCVGSPILFGAAAACAAAAHARAGVRGATERSRATCRSRPPAHASRRPSRAPGGCSRGFVLASDREPRKHMIAPRARAAWPTPRSSSRAMPLAKQVARAGVTAHLGPAGRSERERECLGADQVARLVGRRARRRAIKTAQLDAGLGRA